MQQRSGEVPTALGKGTAFSRTAQAPIRIAALAAGGHPCQRREGRRNLLRLRAAPAPASREAAIECSPRRKPRVDKWESNKPQRGERKGSRARSFVLFSNQTAGASPLRSCKGGYDAADVLAFETRDLRASPEIRSQRAAGPLLLSRRTQTTYTVQSPQPACLP